jgi:NAD(P)-dependent dehydrogenase (short-subunit alcohol dehydrogenase family)
MGKKILITGAGSGFGKGAALELARRGHEVIASTETQEQADTLAPNTPS